MKNSSPNKIHAQIFMTVWLKNIDRLLKPIKSEVSEYSFIDIGCGRGVSTLYVADRYRFNAVRGLDFEEALIADANTNKANFPQTEVEFFVADAGDYKLRATKNAVFMFNPFGEPVMESFMRNNIELLRATRSVIAYANYHHLETILKYEPANVIDIKEYRCALIAF